MSFFTSLRLGLLLILAALTACRSAPEPVNPNAGRYSLVQDRAPARELDPAQVPEVIPVAVQRGPAGNRSPYSVLGQTYHVLDSERGYSERGIASWYGQKFHGHRTSNGEIFDMYLASAAHKALPLPSFLKVTNLDNNRSIVVRVNDRGPFHGDRLIDLSYGAAVKLGFADRGTARVQLDAIVPAAARRDRGLAALVTSAPPIGGRESFLQVGAFAEIQTARAVSAKLRGLTDRPVFIRSIRNSSNQTLHRVRVGPVNDPLEIQRLTQRVVAADLGSPYTVAE